MSHVPLSMGVPFGADQKQVIRKQMEFETMQSLIASQFASVPTCFTVTTGRSGSRVLRDLMALSPRVTAEHEAYPSLAWLGKVHLGWPFRHDDLVRTILLMRGTYVQRCSWLRTTYFEASLNLWPLAKALKDCFCNIRWLHLVRNPRSFVQSGVAHKWMGPDETELAHLFPLFPGDLPQWKKLIQFWVATHRAGVLLEEDEDIRTLRVHAKDLWTSPETTLAILRWMGTDHARAHLGSVGEVLQKGYIPHDQKKDRPMWTEEMEEYLQETGGELLEKLELE